MFFLAGIHFFVAVIILFISQTVKCKYKSSANILEISSSINESHKRFLLGYQSAYDYLKQGSDCNSLVFKPRSKCNICFSSSGYI